MSDKGEYDMDQNSIAPIDPIVSTDPALDAELRAQIAEWDTALRAHAGELKKLGTTSGMKAERKAIKDAITICETTIKGLRAKLPASYIDPNLLGAYLIQQLDSMDSFEADKAKFIAQVTDNPAYAIEWYAGPLAMSQTRHQYFSELKLHLQRTVVSGFPAVIAEYIAMITRDLIGKVRLNGSTSTFDRAVELAEQEARAEMIGDFNSLNRLMFTVNSFLERMATTDPIRLEHQAQRAAEQAGADDVAAGEAWTTYHI